jgi:hypothetical protein
MADKDTKQDGAQATKDSDSDSKNTTLPKRETKVSSKKEDGSEHLKVPGSGLKVRRIDREDDDYTQRQDEALMHYRVTGVVGDYQDPLRDQEPDIAPEFGVAPHPELQNPAPPKHSVGAQASRSRVTDPVEDKVKEDDPSRAQGQSADTGTGR